jgi:hypothetical protein
VQAGEEQGVAEPGLGDLVAVGAGDALDEAMDAEPAQVIGELPAGHVLISPANRTSGT